MTRLRALLCLLSWGSSGTSALLSSRNRVSSRHVPSPPLPQLQQQQQLCLQQSSPVRREGVVLSATVVERGLELEVGDTFFRRESQLSRDMSVLAAHLHREAIAAEVTTAQATAVETAAAATTRKDDSENGSSSGSGSDPDSDTASSSASNSAPSSASSSSSASGASYSFKVVDAYSGVGSRAARYLHQAGATAVLANDANEDTHPFLLKNLATTTTATSSSSSSSSSRRGSGNVTVTHMDAQRLLLRLWQEKDFQDVVDCDSFGYAPRAISAALHAVKLGGLVYVTNTDGRGSAGKAPAKALAAYGTWATHHSAVNEQGLRMLVGMAAREAASLGLEVRPLFSLYSPHGPVYRSMLRVLPCRRPDVFLETRYQFTAHCNRCGQASAVPWGALGAVAATAEGGAVSAVRCNCAAAVNDPAVASTAEEDDKNNERGRWWQFWRRRRRRRVTTTSSSTTRSEEQQRQQPPAQPPPSPQPQQLFNMSGPMWVAPLQDPEMLDQMAQLAIEWGWDEDEADSALLPTLRTLQQEADPRLPPFYLHTHELAKRAGVSPPPKRLIFEELRRGGFLARRTHIEKFGLKTDADAAVCVAATQRAAAAAETAAAARREKRAKKARQEKQKQAKPVAKRKKKGDRGRPWGTQKEKPI